MAQGLLPGGQGQHLALTVLHVPCSLDSRSFSSSLLLSSLELSETKIYEPQIRTLLGTASHFCEVTVLQLTLHNTFESSSRTFRFSSLKLTPVAKFWGNVKVRVPRSLGTLHTRLPQDATIAEGSRCSCSKQRSSLFEREIRRVFWKCEKGGGGGGGWGEEGRGG